jgi:hypothetical protein
MSILNKYNTVNADNRTGINLAHGVYEAIVMENRDALLMGRLAVYIPELGGNVSDPQSWKTVRYASPFYGITPYKDAQLIPGGGSANWGKPGATEPRDAGSQGQQQQQQPPITSYGMWAVPPDLGVTVLVMFAGGDLNRGFWFACVPTVSHGMVPAIGAPDGKTPMAEFNPIDPQVPTTEDLTSIQREPYEPLVSALTAQGINEDPLRGPITSSSFREAPSNVFGISSKGGHTFVMDDGSQEGTSKLIRLRTAGGNQITMHDDTGMIYMINAQGTGWIEISPSGQIDVFGAAGINMATNGEINLHADKNVNIHAGECVKIVGMKGTKVMGGEELQLHGKKTMIEGVDSLHVHSCKEMMFTSFGDIHMKAFNYFCLKGKCFYWNSCTAKEAEQVPPEKPADVSGYQTTVARAPAHEPYKEHDNGQSQGGGGGAPAGGTGAAGGGGSATDAGGMFGGIAGGGPAALNNPVTTSNFANPKAKTQLTGGSLADAGGLSGLASMSDPSSPFRATASAGITPTNSVSSYGMNFNGGTPNSVAIAPSASIAAPSAARNTTMQGAVRTSTGTSVSSTYTASTTVSGGPGAPLYTKPSSITVNTSTTTQVGPNASTTNTTTQNIDPSSVAANPYLGRGGQQPVGADPALANVETPGQQPTGVFGSQNPADQALTGATPAQEASNALGQMGGMVPSSDLPAAPGGGGTGCFAQGDNCERPADETGGPGGAGNAQPGQRNFTPPDELKNDPEFQKKLAEMKAKYPGLTDQQIYNVIGGESGFNFAAVNSQSGATGAFQFTPSTAAGLGYSTAQIQAMTPAQQLGVYDQYLSSNGYKGGSLGIMQAAPAYAGASGNTIVYQRGSAAWNQNPGWRGSDGNITVNSINRYYGY